MTHRSSSSEPVAQRATAGDEPAPDIAAFIRFCHARRGAAWPELYDEMCAVAARREFNGWDHAELAARGLSFSLFDMPKLAAWARVLVDGTAERTVEASRTAGAPRLTAEVAAA